MDRVNFQKISWTVKITCFLGDGEFKRFKNWNGGHGMERVVFQKISSQKLLVGIRMEEKLITGMEIIEWKELFLKRSPGRSKYSIGERGVEEK